MNIIIMGVYAMTRRNITQDDVVKAIQKGIISAQSDYKRSAEGLISYAPEYLSTVMAFKSILHKLKALDKLSGSTSGYITLECPTNYIGTIIKRGPKPKDNPLTAQSRVDLLLWAASGAPRAVIEIKRDFHDSKGIEDDIERISQFPLYCKPKPVFGIFTTIVYKDVDESKAVQETEKSVWEEIEKVKQLVENSAIGLCCHRHDIDLQRVKVVDDDGIPQRRVWCPLCFTLRRTRKRRD